VSEQADGDTAKPSPVVQKAGGHFLGIAGACIPPALLLLLNKTNGMPLPPAVACSFVGTLWLAAAFIIGRESWDSVTRMKRILCDALLRENVGLVATFCRARVTNFISAIFVGVLFSTALLVFTYTVPISFFVVLFVASVVFVAIRVLAQKIASKYANTAASVLTRRFAVTGLVGGLLMVCYFGWAILTPVEAFKPGSPDVADHVINTIEHGCRTFQHLARTSAFVDTTIRSLGNIPEIGGWIFLATFASFLSAVPMVAFVMCVRFGYESLSLVASRHG
jgi:lipid-A-disaccharide synthase-like uncharacterized protein